MREVNILLPDDTQLSIPIRSSQTVGELLKAVLAGHEILLRNRSRLSRIAYAEWRLSLEPRSPGNKVWTKNDIRDLFKPLEGHTSLQEILGGQSASSKSRVLFLYHVLSSLPVKLQNLPHSPTTTFACPTLDTMSPETMREICSRLIGFPARTDAGTSITYETTFFPTEQRHKDITTISVMVIKSNLAPESWLRGSLSRPASLVGSWLGTMSAADPSVPISNVNTDEFKKRISPPVQANTITHDPIKSCHAQGISSSDIYEVRELGSIEKDFDALLEDLQIPVHKRQPFYKFPVEKRASLLAQERIFTKTDSHIDPLTRTLSDGQVLNFFTSAVKQTNLSNETTKTLTENPPDLTPQRRSRSPFRKLHRSQAASPSPERTVKARSKSPIRLNMSSCPPKLEWDRAKSPVRPQKTGSSWISSWWTKGDHATTSESAEYFVARLKLKSDNGGELLKELVKLRIHIGTARASWISAFLAERGLTLLQKIADTSPTRHLHLNNGIWLEILKVFRILLNTECGFQAILSNSDTTNVMCRIAREGEANSKALTFDLLAGICISSVAGHRQVFESLTCALTVTSSPSGRFSWLTTNFRDPLECAQAMEPQSKELIRAALTLANSVVNTWPKIEDRIALRQELFGGMSSSSRTRLKDLSDDIKIQLDVIDEASLHDRECFRADLIEQSATNSDDSFHEALSLKTASAVSSNPTNELAVSELEHLRNEVIRLRNLIGLDMQTGGSVDQFDSSRAISFSGAQNKGIPMDHGLAALDMLTDNQSSSSLVMHTASPSLEPCINHQDNSIIPDYASSQASSGDFGVDLNVTTMDRAPARHRDEREGDISVSQFANSLNNIPYVDICDSLGPCVSSSTSGSSSPWLEPFRFDALESSLDLHEPGAVTINSISSMGCEARRDPELRDMLSRKENLSLDTLRTLGTRVRQSPLSYVTQYRQLSAVAEGSVRDISTSSISISTDLGPADGAEGPAEPGPTQRSAVASDTSKFEVDLIHTEVQSKDVKAVITNPAPGASELSLKPASMPPPFQVPSDDNPTECLSLLSGISTDDNPSDVGPPAPPPPPPPPPPAGGIPFALTLRKATPLPPALHTSRRAPLSNKKLKPLFWEKISNDRLNGSIWTSVSNRIDNELHQELMLSDLEKFFGKDNITNTRYGVSPFAKSSTVLRKITLIDHQRAKNIEVMLARVKLSYVDIANALLNMQDEKLGTYDQLRIMQKNAPTDEEISLVDDYKDDHASLGNAEKYIRAIGHVPQLDSRLQALIFRRRFDSDVAEILPEMQTLDAACKEVTSCKVLQEFLALALTAGNILNGSTFRGNAEGFHLDALIKLGEVRSSAQAKSGATLLHYLVAIMQKKSQVADFQLSEELNHCAAAARICSQTVLENAASLEKGFNDIEATLSSPKFATNEDKYVATMSEFVHGAKSTVAQVSQSAILLQKQIAAVVDYFGEESSKVRVEDIFATLRAFVELVDRAREENLSLSGNHILRSKTSLSKLSVASAGQSFDGTLKAMRAGRRTGSREVRDRPASRVFPPPF